MSNRIRPQSIEVNFNKDESSIRIIVYRIKNRAKYIILKDNETLDKGTNKRVTLWNVLLEVVCTHGCLPDLSLCNCSIKYPFRDADVEVVYHDKSWDLIIKYRDGRETKTKPYSYGIHPANVVNSLETELGIPTHIDIPEEEISDYLM